MNMQTLFDASAKTPLAKASAHVMILLCTHNGAAFLQEQLASFLAQDHDDWSLWVSDDHSHDDTLTILERFRDDHPERNIHLFQGPGRGLAANYLSLLCQSAMPVGYVAMSDQDDIWLPDRLSRAVREIQKAARGSAEDKPVLYGSRTRLVDAGLTPIGTSRPVTRAPSFGNALVQNVMAGNTLAMNPAAMALARNAGADTQVPYHDWWLYLLLSGADARLVFDDRPSVLYRQHNSNSLGTNRSFKGKLRRLRMVRNAEYRDWINQNLAALTQHENLLTERHRHQATTLADRNQQGRLGAVRRVWQSGAHRQGRLQSLFIFWAALTRLI